MWFRLFWEEDCRDALLSCRSCGHPSHNRWEEEEEESAAAEEEEEEEEAAAEEMLKSKHLQDRLKI